MLLCFLPPGFALFRLTALSFCLLGRRTLLGSTLLRCVLLCRTLLSRALFGLATLQFRPFRRALLYFTTAHLGPFRCPLFSFVLLRRILRRFLRSHNASLMVRLFLLWLFIFRMSSLSRLRCVALLLRGPFYFTGCVCARCAFSL